MNDSAISFTIVSARQLSDGRWDLEGGEGEKLILHETTVMPVAGMEFTAYGPSYWGPYRAVCLDGVPVWELQK